MICFFDTMTQFSEGVSMQMQAQTKELSVILSSDSVRFLEAYQREHNLNNASEAINAVIKKAKKEEEEEILKKWRALNAEAMKDPEYVAEQRMLAEAGVDDGIE